MTYLKMFQMIQKLIKRKRKFQEIKVIENTNEMDNLINNNVQSNNTSEIDSVILPQGNDDNDEELFTIDAQKK